jgi:hypothetical protein
VLKPEASLGNALLWVKGLDAKLKANKKSYEEAQACLVASKVKHKEELAAAKQVATQIVKKAEARAAAMEDHLARLAKSVSNTKKRP